MNVRALIDRLSTMPADAEVVCYDDLSEDALGAVEDVQLVEGTNAPAATRMKPYVWIGLDGQGWFE